MNSRVHSKYETKYRVTNWAEYDRALVERGDNTLWITPEAFGPGGLSLQVAAEPRRSTWKMESGYHR